MAALVLAGCGGAVSSLPPPTADLAKAAHDQLCNPAGGGSLSKVATELDNLDPNADTAQLQATLGTLLLNLQQLEVDETAKPIRDAAGTAVLALQSSLKDPSKRGEAATKAAAALRAVETGVCT
jgi:hypothetical protein